MGNLGLVSTSELPPEAGPLMRWEEQFCGA